MSSEDKDDFINDLSHLWQTQESATELDLEQALSLQKKRKLALVFDLFQVAVLLATGVFFSVNFSSYYVIAAGAFLCVSGALLLIAALKIHWKAVNYGDWSSLGVLEYRKLVYTTSINHWRIHQLGCLIVLAFAGVTVLLYFSGSVSAVTRTLMLSYLVAIPCLLVLYLYLGKRINKVKAQLHEVDNMLKELSES